MSTMFACSSSLINCLPRKINSIETIIIRKATIHQLIGDITGNFTTSTLKRRKLLDGLSSFDGNTWEILRRISGIILAGDCQSINARGEFNALPFVADGV